MSTLTMTKSSGNVFADLDFSAEEAQKPGSPSWQRNLDIAHLGAPSIIIHPTFLHSLGRMPSYQRRFL